jgi:hypothetical protein
VLHFGLPKCGLIVGFVFYHVSLLRGYLF